MLVDQWFIVLTLPQRESMVVEQLDGQGAYLPRYKTPDGRVKVLFPGYLFVPCVDRWSPIMSTIGVRAMLMSGEKPATVANKVIASWKDRERGGLVQLPPAPRFKIGARLVITNGSLKHRRVIYAGMNGKQRERVLIDMLGGQITIFVPSADLAPEFEHNTRNRLRSSGKRFTGERDHPFLAGHA
jgi:transcriptional antiterminator RfaH